MRLITISILQFFVIAVHAQIIDFVDLEFKQFLVSELCVDTNDDDIYDSVADTNGDAEIDMSEALNITSLGSESYVGISSLADIIHFTNLEKFKLKNTPALDSVDFSNMPLLEELAIHLKDQIISIQDFTALRFLDLEIDDLVKEVRVNRNINLEHAIFDGGSTFSGIDSLQILDVSENKLSKLEILLNWVDGGPVEKMLFANDNALTEIYVDDPPGGFSNILELYQFDVSNNLLSEDSFTGLFPVASHMDLSNNEFKAIMLDLVFVPMFSFVVDNNPLEVLNLNFFNEQTDIDLLELENLHDLYISTDGKINSIIIKDSPDLNTLDLYVGDCDGDLILDQISYEAVMRINFPCDVHVIGMEGTFDWIKTEANLYVENSLTDGLIFSGAFEFDTLHVYNNSQLEYLEIEDRESSTGAILRLNVYDLPNLRRLLIEEYNTATFLNVVNCPELNFLFVDAEELHFEHDQLPKLESLEIIAQKYNEDFTNLPRLKYFSSNINDDISISLNDLPLLDSILLTGGMLKYFKLNKLPLLKTIDIGGNAAFEADCHNHPFRSSVVFQNLPSVVSLKVNNLCAQDFIINNLPSVQILELENIGVAEEPVQSMFMVSDIPLIDTLELNDIDAVNIILDGLPNVEEFIFDHVSASNSFEFDNTPQLKNIDWSFCFFKDLNVVGYEYLEGIYLDRSSYSSLTLDKLPLLKRFRRTSTNFDSYLSIGELESLESFIVDGAYFSDFLSDTLSFAQCPKIDTIVFNSLVDLKFLNLKNGNNDISHMDFSLNNMNASICVDDEVEEQLMFDLINFEGQISTNCETELNKHDISGKVYIQNQFGTFFPMTVGTLELAINDGGHEYSLFTGSAGKYDFTSNTLNSDIQIKAIFDTNKYEILNNPLIFNLGEFENIYDADIFLALKENTTDLLPVVNLVDQARPSEIFSFSVEIQNIGTIANSGKLSLEFDEALMSYVGEQGTINENILEIAIDNISSFGQRHFIFDFLINTPTDSNPVMQDDELRFKVKVDSDEPDVDIENNSLSFVSVVVNSYDPNEIECLQGNVVSNNLLDETIHYTIHFENLGNADALNVRIENPLDTHYLDLSTIRILDFSHHVVSQIESDTLVFNFDDINLPYFDQNKGYVTYSVRVKNALAQGEFISNQAFIYFDFNPAIITNLHMLLFELDANDADQDGYSNDIDCDDGNPEINPGEFEVPYNGLDDDCDPLTLDDDLDQDGFVAFDDCDDLDADINPAADEVMGNGIDDNCNGLIDEIVSTNEVAYHSYKIYPNPTNDVLHIEAIQKANYKVELLDYFGRLLLTSRNIELINLEGFEDGAYIIRITDERSKEYIHVEKIFKSKF